MKAYAVPLAWPALPLGTVRCLLGASNFGCHEMEAHGFSHYCIDLLEMESKCWDFSTSNAVIIHLGLGVIYPHWKGVLLLFCLRQPSLLEWPSDGGTEA